jgi:hypothetical protein
MNAPVFDGKSRWHHVPTDQFGQQFAVAQNPVGDDGWEYSYWVSLDDGTVHCWPIDECERVE